MRRTSQPDPFRLVNRASQLRHSRRQISRVHDVLEAMRAGQLLHLEHHADRPLWSLSDGTAVPADIAILVTHNAAAAPTGDSLFPDLMLGQTWRLR